MSDAEVHIGIDQTALRVQMIAEVEWPRISADVTRSTVREILVREPAPADSSFDSVSASNYLNRLRTAVEDMAINLVQSHPASQWLWYLRRLPNIFEGSLSTTEPYDRVLAETLSGMSSKHLDEWPIRDGEADFPITEGYSRGMYVL